MPIAPVPDELVRYFAADGIGPQYTLAGLLSDRSHEVYAHAEKAMGLFSEDELSARKQVLDAMGLWSDDQPDEFERRALRSLLEDELNRAVAVHRMHLLRDADNRSLLPPYDLPEADGLYVDTEGLTDLRQLAGLRGPFQHGDYLFSLLLPLPAQNSGYWLTLVLRQLLKRPELSIRVRLDPTLHGPVGRFSQMEHRAWWYGTDLDWDEIAGLKGIVHRQAGPDERSEGVMSKTDLSWERRGAEVHFVCEELPPRSDVELRGSRFLHAVYRPDLSTFVHVDGAVRILTGEEWDKRFPKKAHEVGKVGRRIKVFRIDGFVTHDEFGALAATLFQWNPDVAEYLHGNPTGTLNA